MGKILSDSRIIWIVAILAAILIPIFGKFRNIGDAKNARPTVPFIQHDVCPFECCQFGKWTARSVLKVFQTEGDDSRVSFTIQPGETFTATGGNVHIVKLGVIVINNSFDNFNKDDEVYVLSYRGEGEYDLWFNGKELSNTKDVWAKGTLRQSPEFVWWVSIINKDGKTGWLRFKNISDNGFQTEDKVDGHDSCS